MEAKKLQNKVNLFVSFLLENSVIRQVETYLVLSLDLVTMRETRGDKLKVETLYSIVRMEVVEDLTHSKNANFDS